MTIPADLGTKPTDLLPISPNRYADLLFKEKKLQCLIKLGVFKIFDEKEVDEDTLKLIEEKL
jgi:hypothetical protein